MICTAIKIKFIAKLISRNLRHLKEFSNLRGFPINFASKFFSKVAPLQTSIPKYFFSSNSNPDYPYPNQLIDNFDEDGDDLEDLRKLSSKIDSKLKLQNLEESNSSEEAPKTSGGRRKRTKTKFSSNEQQKTENTEKASTSKEIKVQPKTQNQNSDYKEPESVQDINLIPYGLALKHLVWPPTKADVLLLGIERRNSLHCSFLNDILMNSKADQYVLQIAPDEPYFIRTKTDYKTTWKNFVKGNLDQKFLVNPNPKFLSDIMLDQEKIKMFIEGPVMQTEEVFEIGSNFIYSNTGSTIITQVIDGFLTPFLYAYNNPDNKTVIIVNDVPILMQRDYLVRTVSKDDLKELVTEYIESLAQGHTNFDPQLLRPDDFIYPRIKYITETIRHACHSGKRIIAVVDVNFIDLIEDEWRKLDKNMRSFSECLLPQVPNTQKMTYTEYIEKHVMLDLIQEPFLMTNFIKYKTFPFSGNDTIGMHAAKPNLFMIWDHFYNRYTKKINDRVPHLQEMMLSGKMDIDDEKKMDELVRDKFK